MLWQKDLRLPAPPPFQPMCLLSFCSHEWDNEVSADEGLHDSSSAAINIDFEKCLKCGRCVTACGLIQVCK